MSEWREKNLPPHDLQWKMKMTAAYLRKKGYSEEEVRRKTEWMYSAKYPEKVV